MLLQGKSTKATRKSSLDRNFNLSMAAGGRNWREYTEAELEIYFENLFLQHGVQPGLQLSPSDFAVFLGHCGFAIASDLLLAMVTRADVVSSRDLLWPHDNRLDRPLSTFVHSF